MGVYVWQLMRSMLWLRCKRPHSCWSWGWSSAVSSENYLILGTARHRRLQHLHGTCRQNRPLRCLELPIYVPLTSISIRRLFSDKVNNRSRTFLANENLVSFLLARSKPPASSAAAVNVRLVRGKENGSDSKVVTLAEAIELSLQKEEDLVGVALEQDIPVVKLAIAQKLVYETTRRDHKASRDRKPPTQKEVQIKGGIAENDLQRKLEQIAGFLASGHLCLVTVKCRSKDVATNKDAARSLATRIMDSVGVGDLVNQVKVYGGGNMAQFLLRPNADAIKRTKEI